MTDPTPASADPEAVAALKRRRRWRRWATVTATWIGLAALPTALQIEPKPEAARLETLRIEGPAGGASGAISPAAGRTRYARAPTVAPAPIGYGAVREALPSELELRAGLGPGRVIEAPLTTQAVLSDAQPSFLPATGAGAPTPFSFPTPSSPLSGLPTSFITGPISGTTPSTPGSPGTTPTSPSTPIVPPVITPPSTTTTTPTSPSTPSTPSTPPGGATPPVVVILPPPGGTTPITVVTPPDTPPDGTTPITVDTPPPDTGVSVPVTPENPPPPVSGVPEPQLWLELIAGFALAGLSLRRRRQFAG